MAQGPIQTGGVPTKQKNITTSATTVVKAGPGIVSSVVVSKSQNGASMVVYDGVDAGGVPMATVDLNNFGAWTPPAPVAFSKGLTVVTTSLTTGSVTFFYQ
jgi:hypothetical protein